MLPSTSAALGVGVAPLRRFAGMRVDPAWVDPPWTARVCAGLILAALSAQAGFGEAVAAALPRAVGQCAETTITRIGYRLGTPESGSAISYANDGVQVSYDRIRAIHRSRRGDRVRLCLVFVPQGCPKGDDRGRIYRATNLRTGESWEAPDAAHSCGGA